MISFDLVWRADGNMLVAYSGSYRLSVSTGGARKSWNVDLIYPNAGWHSYKHIANGEADAVSEACDLAERAFFQELLQVDYDWGDGYSR